MNYKISLSDMDKLAMQANSKKNKISIEEMRKQATTIRNKSISKIKKKQVK